MQINWKVRFTNRQWLLSVLAILVHAVFQLCAQCGIVFPFDETVVMNIVDWVLILLIGKGIVMDPTTAGFSDSDRAMTYMREE